MKTKTKYQIFNNYLKKVRNSADAWRLAGHTLKSNTLKAYLYLFYNGYIKINSLNDFINILDNGTNCPANTEIIDKSNFDEFSEYCRDHHIKKKDVKNNFILLHYFNTNYNNIMNCNIIIPCDIVKIIKFVESNENIFLIKGGIWFDRVNGNSYNSSIIYNNKTNEIHKKPLEYGYDNAYFYDSINYLIDNKIIPNVKIINDYKKIFKNLGSSYMKKTDCKNWNY